MRRISPFAINVKAMRRFAWCVGVGQLPEAWVRQATVASEDLPLRADHWPRGNSGEFVLAIWFVEISKRDIQPAQTIQAKEKLPLIGNADDDKMGMR